MNYYLSIDDKWYCYSDGRWQFIGDEAAEARLRVVISSTSDILEVTRLGVGEAELMRELSTLQLKPGASWIIYREAGKEAKDGLGKEG